MQHICQEIHEAFLEKYKREPELWAFAPGRVNLIGEHIDYNGGHVLPFALDIGTYGALAPRADGQLNFYSLNFRGIGVISMTLNDLKYDQRDHWTNYMKGMIVTFAKHGLHLEHGFDLVMRGNIPNSSGLSSSASVELLMAVLLRQLLGAELSQEELALWAQEAENDYIGVRCGIMDQYAIACGLQDRALLLDTATLACEAVPIELERYQLLIACSNKKRGLAASAYNERRQQCEQALADLQRRRPELKHLCELSEAEFAELADVITDPVCRRRARHAVSEEARTIAATAAMRAKRWQELADLMSASHASLRDDYEVTGLELDTLVAAAMAQPGCIGARMTGAGFGGCTINLVERTAIPYFCRQVGERYSETCHLQADFYPVTVGAGARLLTAAEL